METEHVPEGIEAAALARGARAREAVWRARAARAPTPALRQHSLNLADDYAVYAAELEQHAAETAAAETEERESLIHRLARRVPLARH